MSKHLNVLQKFGMRVREARTAKRISQEAFASLCGLDRTYISGIERGTRNIGLRNVAAVAKALDVTISELTKGI